MTLEFIAGSPPPATRTRTSKYKPVLDALAEKIGVWAILSRDPKQSASMRLSLIYLAKKEGFDNLLEVTVTGGVLYARWKP